MLSLVLQAGLAGAEAAGCGCCGGRPTRLGQRVPLQLVMDCVGRVAGPEQVGEPRLAIARHALADLYFLTGQWDDALAEIDLAVDLPAPDYLPTFIHGLIALIAAHRADWRTAEDHVAGRLDPQADRFTAMANAHFVLPAGAVLAAPPG